ncbi:LLM class flavin-dependent oxidoreductase [Nocardiopsis composta]|uniref:Alkanesulfonate monooxygenase SsuD/methylene tetrahydromethanopterin reductase-like flavin-dependent oxidoreductase (Luciferase family) n=1 Tax=Nocardiopsis composta TaxID=157465 RepID=A0A7W8QHV1_9ACTN|nr:LLM class flavin-dependent oxidoreductase [Nocardiopsis composta]MBB5430053.1 alkanesulfonate monooxygenase SsuD/methylene tetrahydromethanopterin reductase-like flavin-dependent oxidoreductase (luciferase family) [Nocardiopsis composta]
MTGTASPAAELHIGAAIDGTGAHPASWRLAGIPPADLFTAGHYAGLAAEAERGTLDFVALDDGMALQSDREDRLRGRLDALLALAAAAPPTERVGLVPTVTTTHTEPFHVSKAVATLDHVSLGRAGWRAEVSRTREEADAFGRRPAAPPPELWTEAAAVMDAAGRLWDSWDDDAEIRDAATGRFIDRDRLHYIDYEGPGWSVRGPSITPRPPQGRPPVLVRISDAHSLAAAAVHADAVIVRPSTVGAARAIRARIREAAAGAGRDPGEVRVLAEAVVLLEAHEEAALERRSRLDALDPDPGGGLDHTGTPSGLADLFEEWARFGAADGFLVRPAVLPDDLSAFVDGVVPRLRERGLFRRSYRADTLRGHLGLARPAGRYARR